MIIDAQSLNGGTVLESDVCIIGAGPAGLVLANELAGPSLRVVLLEAGDLDSSEVRQSLLDGDDLTGEYHNPRESRHCQLGGTVRIWNTPIHGARGAKYVPLDEIDFERREWVPHSGWPFARAELVPFYERAHKLCGLGPFKYDAASWADGDCVPFEFGDDRVTSGVYQLGGPQPFTERLTKLVRESPHISCVLNAPVGEMVGRRDEGKVSGARIVMPGGKFAEVRARRFILAAGGIENARLLLASQSQCAAGLGNEFDVVGRYFMDHPIHYFTEIQPTETALFQRAGFYDLREVCGTTVLGRLTLSPEALRENHLLNFSVVLYPRIAGYRSPGIEALRQLRFNLRQRRIGKAARFALPVARGIGDIMAYAQEVKHNPAREGAHYWHRAALCGSRFATWEPEFYIEQPPEPGNRVMLSERKDALGRPLSAIKWQWGLQSRNSVETAAKILGGAFEKAGLGKLGALDFPRLNPSGHHHMGATRMHQNPKLGVVDAECRLHGMRNLFVAGSSVFPTGGYANPTLTVLALCLRLADHLRSEAFNQ